MKWFITVGLLATSLSIHADTLIHEKQYDGFTLWLNCERHGAVAFKYELGKDQGDISREGEEFIIDEDMPATCQPTSNTSYRTSNVDKQRTGTYDRGHLVPANHMDNKAQSFTDTFYLTNILPQQTTFNQKSGAWFNTEVISECYRDIATITIWGGVIWGDDASDDFFVDSHGVATPDYWWKLIKRHDSNDFIAWLFPNSKAATKSKIDDYIVTLDELVSKTKFVPDFGIDKSKYSYKPAYSSETCHPNHVKAAT